MTISSTPCGALITRAGWTITHQTTAPIHSYRATTSATRGVLSENRSVENWGGNSLPGISVAVLSYGGGPSPVWLALFSQPLGWLSERARSCSRSERWEIAGRRWLTLPGTVSPQQQQQHQLHRGFSRACHSLPLRNSETAQPRSVPQILTEI